jgi:glycosyltransferase involved in cell wall biosynthesis
MGGIHRRLDMLAEALGAVSDSLAVLLLVRTESRYTEDERRQYETYLSARWGTRISLTLASVREPPGFENRWKGIAEGVFRFDRNYRFRQLDNPQATAAVASAFAERPRIVLVHRLEAMSVLLRLPKSASAGTRVFFDLDDVEHISAFRRLLREPSWPAERFQILQVPAIMAGERRAIKRADLTFVCSQKDKRYLETMFGKGRIHVVPNPAAVSDTPMPHTSDPVVMYVGVFEYPPNVRAADRLVKSVWPRVRAAVPDAKLFIVGKHPEKIPAFSSSGADGSVSFTGFVDDIAACYAKARVVCCPIRVGAGTRVKIIEAAAFARPVVSTPLGAEGLEFRDNTEIVLRERDEDLAEACAECWSMMNALALYTTEPR